MGRLDSPSTTNNSFCTLDGGYRYSYASSSSSAPPTSPGNSSRHTPFAPEYASTPLPSAASLAGPSGTPQHMGANASPPTLPHPHTPPHRLPTPPIDHSGSHNVDTSDIRSGGNLNVDDVLSSFTSMANDAQHRNVNFNVTINVAPGPSSQDSRSLSQIKASIRPARPLPTPPPSPVLSQARLPQHTEPLVRPAALPRHGSSLRPSSSRGSDCFTHVGQFTPPPSPRRRDSALQPPNMPPQRRPHSNSYSPVIPEYSPSLYRQANLGYPPHNPGLIHPPPHAPYVCSPLPAIPPPTPAVRIQLHPHILPSLDGTSLSPLRWDICHMPVMAKRHTSRGSLVEPHFKEPAVFPETNNHMFISVSQRLPIASWVNDVWGGIMIKPSSGDTLTMHDVLDGIYTYFQTPISRWEFKRAVAMNEENEASMMLASFKRISKCHQLFEVERRKGLRRVDMLGDFRKFNGLKVKYYVSEDGRTRTWGAVLDLAPAVGGVA